MADLSVPFILRPIVVTKNNTRLIVLFMCDSEFNKHYVYSRLQDHLERVE